MSTDTANNPLLQEPEASTGFQDYLQSISEREKAKLVRDLHDDLGGLLVGAVMDLAWADQNWQSRPADAHEKFARARQSLAVAIDFKRKLVEKLRPSLLENVGLFAALRWHVKAICEETGMECRVDLPDKELRLLPEAAIALFRIVQEVFERLAPGPRGFASSLVITDHEKFNIKIAGPRYTPANRSGFSPDYGLTALRQRTASLCGEASMLYPTDSTMLFTATVPLRRILCLD
jgi:signal transduction histidine kinase